MAAQLVGGNRCQHAIHSATRKRHRSQTETTIHDEESPLKRGGELHQLSWPRTLTEKELPFLYGRVDHQKYQALLQKVEKNDGKISRLFHRFARWRDGEIWIVELPSQIHEGVASVFEELIYQERARRPPPNLLLSTGSMTCKVGSGKKEADSSLRPDNKPRPAPNAAADDQGNPYPNLVLEVGISETLAQLRQDAVEWLGVSTTVQIVVILYVRWYSRRPPPNCRMLVEVYTRANMPPNPENALQRIEFGTTGSTWNSRGTVVGRGQAFLELPVDLLFHGCPGGIPPQYRPDVNLQLDLYEFQREILRFLPAP